MQGPQAQPLLDGQSTHAKPAGDFLYRQAQLVHPGERYVLIGGVQPGADRVGGQARLLGGRLLVGQEHEARHQLVGVELALLGQFQHGLASLLPVDHQPAVALTIGVRRTGIRRVGDHQQVVEYPLVVADGAFQLLAVFRRRRHLPDVGFRRA